MTTPDAIKTINDKKQEVTELTQAQKSKIVICLDSTQIKDFLRCEQLWDYSHNKRYGLVAPYRKDHAKEMGLIGHKYLDIYYKLLAKNQPMPVRTAAAMQIKHTDHPDTAMLEIAEVESVRSRTMMYFHFYASSDFTPLSADHVEVGFSELLYEDCERLYILEGRIDLFAKYQSIDCVVDHKYQSGAKDLYRKMVQFRNYAMVTNCTTFVINYIRLAQKIDPCTLKRDFISFTHQEHTAWKGELKRIFDRVYNRMVYDSGIYEKNYSACSGEFRYPCDFTHACEELNPLMRENKISLLYQIKPEWRPW